MNKKPWIMGLLMTGPVYLLGCSTSAVPPTIVERVSHIVPPYVMPHGHFTPDGKFVPRDPGPIVGRVCQLGTSCLALDPRPFEMCLLASNKHCGEKITESLLAVNPEPAEPR
jgi:hypothetical protein